MGEYIPQAPINDEAKQHNKELPGMGGVFNYVNLHAYHYAGNNPVKLTDPDGNDIQNRTGEDIVVFTENGDPVIVPNGEMYVGRTDGAVMRDGTVIKISDSATVPKTNIPLPIIDIVIRKEGGEYTRDYYGISDAAQNFVGDLYKKEFTDRKDMSGIYAPGQGDEFFTTWREVAIETFNEPPGPNSNVKKIPPDAQLESRASMFLPGNEITRTQNRTPSFGLMCQ
jgi:hypothetical protein